MTKDEALKLALEALKLYGSEHAKRFGLEGAYDEEKTKGDFAITAIKQALADHTEDNLKMVAPVGKYTGETWDGSIISLYDEIPVGTLLYTTPPAQRTWVGLMDEDLRKLADKHLFYQPEGYEVSGVFALARAIETAHGIGEKK
jgi:hypothetical protein